MAQYTVRTNAKGKLEILDRIRKKYVACTEEEKVRQHTITQLIEKYGVPQACIAVETGLKVVAREKRTDLVVYNKHAKPAMIIECKAPSVKIDQQVFDQILRYNMTLQVNYLVLTNGPETYCCQIDSEKQTHTFLEDIPFWKDL